LRGNTLGVVVGNYSSELEPLRGRPRLYFADGAYAWGILEGIEHYDFLGTIRVPEEEGTDHDGDIARLPA
ncbi:MAG: HAD family hydrolase, partial [Gammaproteobacteria bacterium]